MVSPSASSSIFDWEALGKITNLDEVVRVIPPARVIQLLGVNRALEIIGRERVIEALGAKQLLDELLVDIPLEQLQEIVRRRQQQG